MSKRIIVGGSLLVLVAVGIFLPGRAAKPNTAAPFTRPADVVRYSTPTPSEKPATRHTYHSTAVGDQPQYITLPTIHAEGYIQAVGVDQNGAVAAPTNVTLAGWYANMLAPGKNGLSIIDGHVDGKTAPGIFYNLRKLAAGDPFEVALANGQVVPYRVKSVSQVAAASAASKLFARDTSIAGQLNLITCGGAFNRTSGVYNNRIIVVAEQGN